MFNQQCGLFKGGVFILGFVFRFVFPLLASWLLGFLASWLLGFSASWLFGFSASGLFGSLLVYAAFGGFLALAFRILCIPSSSSAGGVLAFAAFRWFLRLLAALAFCVLAFAPFHWFLDLASRIMSITSSSLFFELPPPATVWIVCKVIAPLFESTLLQTSWAPLLFRFLAEIELHPYLNHHFFERAISRENAAKYDILGNLCNPCMSVCMHFFEHHRGSHPRQPSRCLLNSIAPLLESLHPCLNHHFFRHHVGGCCRPQPPRYV